jgi:transposase
LWVLGTGAQWREVPNQYPPYQTCHRRFQQWVREGKLKGILHALAEDLHARGKLELEEAFIDASFTGARKGGLAVGPTKRGKGTKIIVLADDHSLPLAVSIESASPHESQLVKGVLGHSFLDILPTRLIGDKAYDSDRLDRDLADRYGIEMIAPQRGQRREPTQDGRPLRRYRRRWRVERLFAWLHHFRRLVIRWEYHVENFFGMVRLGCMQILFRYL